MNYGGKRGRKFDRIDNTENPGKNFFDRDWFDNKWSDKYYFDRDWYENKLVHKYKFGRT